MSLLIDISYLFQTEDRRILNNVLINSALNWQLVAENVYRPYSSYVLKHAKYTDPIEAISNFIQIAVQLECFTNDNKVIIDFVINEVLEPMIIYEPKLASNEFAAAIKFIPTNRTKAVIYFALLSANTTRHYIYPNRFTYQPPKELIEWLRNLDQGKPMWIFLRCMFLGASNVAALVGANEQWERSKHPSKRKDAQRLLTDCLGITIPEPFTELILDACKHGTTNEDLGRIIYRNLTGIKVSEIGTAVSFKNSCYSHSPDGVGGLIEIKCQKIKHSCYDKCPDLYLPQCLQGMIVHKEPWCDFVSVYYVPSRYDPDEVQFTIERLFYNEEVANWMQRCFDIFSKCLAEGIAELPQSFYIEFEKRRNSLTKKSIFSNIQRGYVKIECDGLLQPAKCITMKLEDAVGSKKEADRWKKINNVY